MILISQTCRPQIRFSVFWRSNKSGIFSASSSMGLNWFEREWYWVVRPDQARHQNHSHHRVLRSRIHRVQSRCSTSLTGWSLPPVDSFLHRWWPCDSDGEDVVLVGEDGGACGAVTKSVIVESTRRRIGHYYCCCWFCFLFSSSVWDEPGKKKILFVRAYIIWAVLI